MQDDLLTQLEQLFDNKLSPIREELGAVHRETRAINRRLDTVAGHLANAEDHLRKVAGRLDTVEEGLKTVIETQTGHGEQLTRIERTLLKHDDRLDVLEAKTAHLPTPPRS